MTFETLDADPECLGLVPQGAPSPVAVSVRPAAGEACDRGTSEGQGRLGIATVSSTGTTLHVLAPGGAPETTFPATTFLAQASGWQVLRSTSSGGALALSVETRGPDGALLDTTDVGWDAAFMATRASLGADPQGGSFALVAAVERAGNHWAGLQAQRLDAGGAPPAGGPTRFGFRSDPQVLFLAAGVSRAGESLAIWQHSAFLDVSWRDRSGAELAGAILGETSADVLGSSALSHALELAPLLDGGLAVRADGAFRRIYPRLATASAPLPAWLAARAAWTFRFTRGNAGYALLPPPGQASADCTQAIDLLAPSGRLCGRVVLHPAAPGACTTGAVDQGWDGTVVQQTAAGACAYRAWHGLLARR